MVKRIKLEKLDNTRDLGGLMSVDGRRVKSQCLLRSGTLSKASVNDINLLINGYNLKTVIDLRTDIEIFNSPYTLPACIQRIECPLLDDSFFGIARDEYSIDAWLNLFKNKNINPKEIFNQMYQKLVFDDHVKEYFNRIFNLLAEADGAVLWHCSAGKDRVGVTTALVLSALNIPRETIIKDYLMTELFTFPEIAKITFFGSLKYHNKRMSDSIRILMSVRAAYLEEIFSRIDREYSDYFDFLEKQFGIPMETVIRIQKKYLE